MGKNHVTKVHSIICYIEEKLYNNKKSTEIPAYNKTVKENKKRKIKRYVMYGAKNFSVLFYLYFFMRLLRLSYIKIIQKYCYIVNVHFVWRPQHQRIYDCTKCTVTKFSLFPPLSAKKQILHQIQKFFKKFLAYNFLPITRAAWLKSVWAAATSKMQTRNHLDMKSNGLL